MNLLHPHTPAIVGSPTWLPEFTGRVKHKNKKMDLAGNKNEEPREMPNSGSAADIKPRAFSNEWQKMNKNHAKIFVSES